MNRVKLSKAFLVLLVVVLVPGLLWGATGKIRGTVTDAETGEPLMGANIVVHGTVMGSATDMSGEYIILNVPPGRYDLVATYMGYQKMTVQDVVVTSGLTTFRDFAMPKVVLEGQEVVIVAERPLVDKNATNDVKVIRSENIESIPIRGYSNVVGAQAGAVQSGGNIYVRGGRTDEVAYYVDGVLMNNPYTRGRTGDLSQNAIEEISYQPGGMNAEYGGFNSGIVSTVTKTGGSQLAVTGEFITDGFLKRNEKSLGLGTYSYGYNLYNLSVGGPVPMTENKVRFYGNVEYLYRYDRSPRWGSSVEPSVFHEDVDTLLALNPEPVELPGAKRGDSALQWTGTGNLYYSLSSLKFKLGGSYYSNHYRDYMHDYAAFNYWSMPKGYRNVYTGYARGTWIVGPTAFVELNANYYYTMYEYGDFLWWDDMVSVVNPDLNPNLDQWGARAAPRDEFAQFATYGRTYGAYNREKIDRWTFKADGTWQVNKTHELKGGLEAQFNTVRFYNVGWRVGGILHDLYETYENPTEEQIASAYRAGYADNAGYDYTGEEEVDSGPDAPRKPKIYSAYIQDKMEFKDLVMNLGIRVDHIQIGQDQIEDPYYIVIDENGLIAQENFIDAATYTEINPRLGFAFPVTDRTVFHLEYGKFTQAAPFDRTYLTNWRLAGNLQQGNYTTSANPSLKPVKTTSYEVGFEQQMGQNAALDVTAFYKEIRDQVQIRNYAGAYPSVYSGFVNGDFGNVKGFSFDFHLRRTYRVMANVNYTLQWASGTGSDPNTQYRIAWQNPGEWPTFVSPLDYDQRHTAAINVDFRTLAEDGPEVGGFHPFGNVGLNIWFTYGSGLAYTPETAVTTVFGGQISRFPTGGINSAHRPATSSLNFRIDKRFDVGPVTINPYIWVINAFNDKNVRTVYNATGLADDDGWFTTLEGQTWAQNNPTAAKWYYYRIADPERFGEPRQIRLGVRFDYK